RTLQIDINQPVFDDFADAWLAVDMRYDLEQEIRRFQCSLYRGEIARLVLVAHGADGDAQRAKVKLTNKRIDLCLQLGFGKLLGKSPKLASPRNRRMIVQEHAVRVTTLAALEGDGNDLSALRVIAETSRIRHADKFIFDQRLVHLQRFRADLPQLLPIRSTHNYQIP